VIDPTKTPAENFAAHYGGSATGVNMPNAPEPNGLTATDVAVLRAALAILERVVGR